jgi:hypothetical protein
VPVRTEQDLRVQCLGRAISMCRCSVQVESAKRRTWMLQLCPVSAHKGLALLGDGNGGDARHMAFRHSLAVGEALGVSIHLVRKDAGQYC